MYAVEGLLKGYDQLLNLVLDETTEFLRGICRHLGICCETLAVCLAAQCSKVILIALTINTLWHTDYPDSISFQIKKMAQA